MENNVHSAQTSLSKFEIRGDLSVEELRALQQALLAIKVAAIDRMTGIDAEQLRRKQSEATSMSGDALSTGAACVKPTLASSPGDATDSHPHFDAASSATSTTVPSR